MNKKVYRQTDKSWANLPYPSSTSTLGDSGCGALSVLHCIIERPIYANKTPKYIQPYMKQFAVEDQGTLWSGIETALKHFGMKNVKWFKQQVPMSDVFKELNKKNRIGVILFSSTDGPDGTKWTSSGHYIAFLKYKYKNKKHYFYLKDSGPCKHDGWFCYETSMKGSCPQVWTCTVPKGDKIVNAATELSYAYKTSKKKWSYKTGKPRAAFKTALKKYMGKTSKISLSDCGYFVTTVVRKSGIDKNFTALKGFKDPFPKSNKFTVAISGKKAPKSKLKSGDVIRYKKKNGSQHTLIYLGDGKIAEAGREVRFPIIRKSTKWNKSNVKLSTLEVLRAKD